MNNEVFLNNYKQKSIYNSNIVEFWAPITDIIIPNIIENRYWISTYGRTWNTNTNRPIGLSMHRKGYYQFALMTKDQRQVTRKLHRALMMSFCYFVGCEQYEVNHKDGIKINNFIWNLEWATSSENTIHAINMGLKTVFGNEYNVTVSNEDINNILYYYSLGCTPTEIKYNLGLNCSLELISGICNGHSRKNSYNKYLELNTSTD